MAQPKKIKLSEPLNPRLVTKTSLSNPKAALALFILLWYQGGKPDAFEYGSAIGTNENGGKGILDQDLLECVETYAKAHNVNLLGQTPEQLIGDNPLIHSQIESLNAAFQLIWHLGSFRFADQAKNLSAERTGGYRYRKRIEYTCNMDLVDLVIQPDEDKLASVICSWLSAGAIACDPDTESKLARTLAAFAETSFYKTKKGEDGIVYAPSGIYDALVDGASVVELVPGGEEAQGTTRILKAAVKSDLNPMLVDHGGSEVARNVTYSSEELREYSARARNAIAVSNIKLSTEDVDLAPDGATANELPCNLIFFGAPGTGKSYQLGKLAEDNFGHYDGGITRVTFHPDYTYAQFVGCYRPYSAVNEDGVHEVFYKFIPGPFIDVYDKARKHPNNKYVLLVEEINRANPAAVFGDVFQLLDRKPSGESEYPISTSLELGRYLYEELSLVDIERGDADVLEQSERDSERVATIAIPSNMFIWATMNSADQGVFPMDTAFKRRWDFHYIGINEGENGIAGYDVLVGKSSVAHYVKWNNLRKAINELLIANKVNEDKLIGPYFIKESALCDPDKFSEIFKSKVLLYLYEDAAKMKRNDIFRLGGTVTYSQICDDFDQHGEDVFKGIKHVPSIDAENLAKSNESDVITADAPSEA